MVTRAVLGILLLVLLDSAHSRAPIAADGTSSSDDGILRKNVESSKMRLVLAVGLEGSGHAFVTHVDDLLYATNPELIRVDDRLTKYGLYHLPNIMASSPEHYANKIAEARLQMRLFKAEELSLEDSPGAVAIMHGKYSYPNGWGPDKVFKYMDLRLLAEAAEAEGVDFRVLYLRRSAREIILANTVHRNFQEWLHGPPGSPPEISKHGTTPEARLMNYMQVLFTDVAVVHSFLGELDSAFIVCHDFDRLGDPHQAYEIAEVLAPNYVIAHSLARSFVSAVNGRDSPHVTEELPYPYEEEVAKRFQRKLDVFESVYCGGENLA